MPEFYRNPTAARPVKVVGKRFGNEARRFLTSFCLRVMLLLFFGLVLATVLLSLDTLRRVRNMLTPEPVPVR